MDKEFAKLTDTDKDNILSFCITSAMKNNGSQRSADENTVDTMKKVIAKYFPKIYSDTVFSCFEKGSLGMLGDFYGLNPRTFTQWLETGYKSEHHKRDFDMEQQRRPDTEMDQITFLEFLAGRLKFNLTMFADWRREYNYLVLRLQFGVDEYIKHLNAAKIQIQNEESGEKRFGRIKIDNGDMTSRAMKIAVCKWLEQHPKPSETLSALMDEKSYKTFRTEN